MKRGFVRFGQKYFGNPLVKLAFAVGVTPPGYFLIETRGRKAGKRRRTPVGGFLEGNTLWIVSEHGRQAEYVGNLLADDRACEDPTGRPRGLAFWDRARPARE